jgi:hypothetical protein
MDSNDMTKKPSERIVNFLHLLKLLVLALEITVPLTA